MAANKAQYRHTLDLTISKTMEPVNSLRVKGWVLFTLSPSCACILITQCGPLLEVNMTWRTEEYH